MFYDAVNDVLTDAIKFMLDERPKDEKDIELYLKNFNYKLNFTDRKNYLFLSISTYLKECEKLGIPVTKFLS
jgi:hypothetical protein